jgi:ribonuclease HI
VDVAHDLWQIAKPQVQKVFGTIKEGWSAPQSGWIKCNVDGAFDARKGQGATGAILRNLAGAFEGGRARWYPYGLDSLMMEALACRDGLILAVDMGIQNLQVETDSQELVKLWTEIDIQRSRISPILKEIKDRCGFFNAFSLMYANRNCNRVAHVLAKQVSDDTRVGEWHVAPPYVSHLMTEDCNPIVP